MKDLKFLNPSFDGGVEVTVRNGDKWLDVSLGEIVALRSVRDEDDDVDDFEGYAVVLGAIPVDGTNPDDLRALRELISLEHDDDCETLEGLHAAMRNAYPQGYGPQLTVLLFKKLDD